MSVSEPWPWQEAFEENERYLLVSGAPPLTGETALAVVELLWALADTIDSTNASEIIEHRRRRERERWWPAGGAPECGRQLRLDLGDDEDF